MKNNTELSVQIAEQRLRDLGMSITKTRVAILHYLMTNHIHPTVDRIFTDLSPQYPSLSRTTVYNTVKSFAESGLVTMLTIDDRQICVDGNTSPHGHLLCNRCGKIIDVPIKGVSEICEIDGHLVTEVQQYYKGVCKECLKAQSEAEGQKNKL